MNRIIIRALRLGSLVEKMISPLLIRTEIRKTSKKTAAILCTVFEDCLCVLKFLHRQKCLFECSHRGQIQHSGQKIIDKAALLFLLLLSRSFLKNVSGSCVSFSVNGCFVNHLHVWATASSPLLLPLPQYPVSNLTIADSCKNVKKKRTF